MHRVYFYRSEKWHSYENKLLRTKALNFRVHVDWDINFEIMLQNFDESHAGLLKKFSNQCFHAFCGWWENYWRFYKLLPLHFAEIRHIMGLKFFSANFLSCKPEVQLAGCKHTKKETFSHLSPIKIFLHTMKNQILVIRRNKNKNFNAKWGSLSEFQFAAGWNK